MVLLALVIVAMLWISLKSAVPLFANLFAGLGVEIPFPLSKLALRSPRLALTTLFVGLPILLIASGVLAWRLLRRFAGL